MNPLIVIDHLTERKMNKMMDINYNEDIIKIILRLTYSKTNNNYQSSYCYLYKQ